MQHREQIDLKSQMLTLGQYIIIFGGVLRIFSSSILFFLRQEENPQPGPLTSKFHWYIWPAVAANAFYTRLFGKRGSGIRDLFSWRSVFVTILVSVSANIACVILILKSMPEDVPLFDPKLFRILVFSYLVFMISNFFGDLVSISITRHILDKMVTLKKKLVRYLIFDIIGIVLGYVITLTPSIAAVFYVIQSNSDLNQLIQIGILGSVIIPFFLIIFATTNMPFPFIILALVAILSITIPTATYIFLIIFINFCYRIYRLFFQEKLYPMNKILYSADRLGNALLVIGATLAAWAIIT